jgi:hypothetical protein
MVRKIRLQLVIQYLRECLKHLIVLASRPQIITAFISILHLDAKSPTPSQTALWSLTANMCYSSKSTYEFITHPSVKQLYPHIPWKLRIPNKVELFI